MLIEHYAAIYGMWTLNSVDFILMNHHSEALSSCCSSISFSFSSKHTCKKYYLSHSDAVVKSVISKTVDSYVNKTKYVKTIYFKITKTNKLMIETRHLTFSSSPSAILFSFCIVTFHDKICSHIFPPNIFSLG